MVTCACVDAVIAIIVPERASARTVPARIVWVAKYFLDFMVGTFCLWTIKLDVCELGRFAIERLIDRVFDCPHIYMCRCEIATIKCDGKSSMTITVFRSSRGLNSVLIVA